MVEYDEDDDFGSGQISDASNTRKRGSGSRSSRLAALDAMKDSGGDPSSLLTSYGAYSGDPYAMGAGLGLGVLAQQRREKKAQDDMKAKLKLEQLGRQDNALSRLVGISEGLRRL